MIETSYSVCSTIDQNTVTNVRAYNIHTPVSELCSILTSDSLSWAEFPQLLRGLCLPQANVCLVTSRHDVSRIRTPTDTKDPLHSLCVIDFSTATCEVKVQFLNHTAHVYMSRTDLVVHTPIIRKGRNFEIQACIYIHVSQRVYSRKASPSLTNIKRAVKPNLSLP